MQSASVSSFPLHIVLSRKMGIRLLLVNIEISSMGTTEAPVSCTERIRIISQCLYAFIFLLTVKLSTFE